MFEKDAEETFRKNYTEYCCGKELLSPYWDLWQDGAEFGYKKANEEHEEKCKTAYIKGIRTMANALKEYDRTNGAWTDYFEHTVEEVLKRLL